MKNIPIAEPRSTDHYSSLLGTSVIDRNGNKASVCSVYRNADTTIAVLAREDGSMVETMLADLERHENSFFTPLSLAKHDREQFATSSELHEEMRIPVAQEEIHIDQRRVDTGKGVRVKKHVLEHEEIVDVPHAEETLSIKHIEVGKVISEDSLPQARQEGDTYIIPVFEEIYVMEKRIRLKEEVHITRERKTSKEDQKIKLRSEQISIERFDDKASSD